jgi:hypothetical protein
MLSCPESAHKFLNPLNRKYTDLTYRLGLTAEDLRVFKIKYPKKSFIYIFQATKQGNFPYNSFTHIVHFRSWISLYPAYAFGRSKMMLPTQGAHVIAFDNFG